MTGDLVLYKWRTCRSYLANRFGEMDCWRIHYLKFLKYFRIFRMSFMPSITPSNTAIPVLNERIIAFVLLFAGGRGENILRTVAIIACFWTWISPRNFFLRWTISSKVSFGGICVLITYLFESVKIKPARKFTIGEIMSRLRKIITAMISKMLIPAMMEKLIIKPPTIGSRI